MIPIEFPEKKLRVYFPENLSECNKKEYINVARFAFAYQNKEINLDQMKTLMVYSILGLKKSKKKLTEKYSEEIWANIALLTEITEGFFIIDEEKMAYRLNIDFLENKIDYFKLFFTKYYGPQDPLKDINVGQWIDAVELILDDSKYPDKNNLAGLLSIFYLKKNEKYDEHYVANKREKRKEKFRFIDPGISFGFKLFLISFMNYLNSASVEVNGEIIDLSIIFESDPKDNYISPRPGIGIRNTAFSMAQTGEFGDYQSVRKEELGNFMYRLYELKKYYLDEKEKEEQKK
ncbi:hypothetical protein [Weeksella sp. HMSC059D05]|uniref:hypothetical protein n=1 Tax=Weeksella sp. HMSC059D05 TaxID=1715139 RepID=UPI0008A3EC62|nr:hypothetical protein [Weeksella sp. HMSC059D05]OFM84582.1 hypothetical protein HMPREF2660_08710 [Weeksella sp. HMSC059D05]